MDLSNRPLAPAPYELLPPVPHFHVESVDFEDGEELPPQFSAPGENVSPGLSWSGFPPETKSFLVTCFDPDAPTPAGFWHWSAVDIPGDVTDLERGAGCPGLSLPVPAFHVRNDGGGRDYMGPYPPAGDRPHRYIFAVHALDVDSLGLSEEDSPTKVAFTALFHTLARATITGTFQL